jgi:mannosyltransferase
MEPAQQEHSATVARESWIRQHAFALGLWSIVALGAGLRFFLIGDKPIWLDEAVAIWEAQRGLRESWYWLTQVEFHPPAYFALLHLWQWLCGDLPAATRALSAVCGTLTLPLFFAFARRLTDRPVALLATFILAISPFHVRFAQEARMYALLSLGVSVGLYLLSRILFDQEHRARFWLGLALSEAAAMLTHNMGLLFPLALNVGMLGAVGYQASTGRPTSFPITNARAFSCRWVKYQALALGLWSPWLVPLVRQTSTLYQRYWLPFPSVRIVWRAIENFNFSSIPRGFPYLSFWIALYLVLALFGVINLRRSKATALLLLSLFLVPIAAEALISLKRPMFLDRTLIWVTLPYYLLIAAGIRGFGRGIWPGDATAGGQSPARGALVRRALIGAQVVLVAVVVALTCFALKHYYFDYKKEEWATAARFVARRTQPGDVVVFNTALGQAPFQYYFRDYHRQVEMRGLPVDLAERREPEPTMTVGDIPYARRLLQDRTRVWLVYSHESYTDPDRLVWRLLREQMRPGETRGFVGLKVTLFERKQDSGVSSPRVQ